MENKTISLTFGDAGENHAGMEMLGNLGEEGSGFTCEELIKIGKNYENSEYHNFLLDEIGLNAGILIIRNFINHKKHLKLFDEFNNIEWDKKYYDLRRKKVLNKLARSNIVILDGIEQKPDYENKKGKIVNGENLKYFSRLKRKMVRNFNEILNNNKCSNLICEGNQYFDLKKCGIGYHGDAERRKVIALRLGQPMKMNWQWFHRFKPVGNTFEFEINGGDLYIMSEKAVGNDWKKSSQYTMRHAAGCDKYINLRKYGK